MNNPTTCVYGNARKPCDAMGVCTRPRELPCLCGLVKARIPEPGPDKLTGRRWPFPGPLSRQYLVGDWDVGGTDTGRMPADFSKIEERVVAMLAQDADFTQALINNLAVYGMQCPTLGKRCPTPTQCSEPAGCLQKRIDWEAWKPCRDVD